MKWLEVIEIRTSESTLNELKNELKYLINELNRKNGVKLIKLYSHVSVKNDFKIHLTHTNKQIESCGSKLGKLIASNLKSYGLVNHNIWKMSDIEFNEEIGC